MELKCIPFLHSSPPQQMLFFSVAEIMRRDVIDFSTVEKYDSFISFLFFSLFSFPLFYSLLFSHLNLRVSDVLRVLKLHNHGAFPVVDRGPHVYPSLLLFLRFILFYYYYSFFFFLFFLVMIFTPLLQNNSHYFRGTITYKQLLILLKNKVFTSVNESDMNQQISSLIFF